MLQYSKVLRGREEWKAKAIARATENREHRKAIRHYRRQIAGLKAQNKTLAEEQVNHSEKTEYVCDFTGTGFVDSCRGGS